MSKKKIIITAIVALLTFSIIGGILAYFTNTTQTLSNTFTVGENVEISLTEPNWDAPRAQGLSFGTTVPKDPTVRNTGSNNAYVFVKVDVPTYYKYTSEGPQNIEMFTYTLNSGWYELGNLETENIDGTVTHIYAYGSSSAMTALEPSATATIFNSVTFLSSFPYSSNYQLLTPLSPGSEIGDEIGGEIGGGGETPSGSVSDPAIIPASSDINVTAYAIQTNGLSVDNPSNPGHYKSAVTPAEVYECLYGDVPVAGGLIDPNPLVPGP